MQAALHKPLTNRADSSGALRFALPEDGFIQLVPRGSAPNVRGTGEKIIQQVDDIALESMLAYLLNRGGEMLIDFEHFSHDLDKPTDAAAWQPCDAEHLQKREDGLYGKPRWSAEGESAITGGKLRYISPEFPPSDSLLVNVAGKVFRPLAVTGFGLTNRPGFRIDAKPLTNSGRPTAPADNPEVTNMHKALLALALGLPETEIENLDEATLRQKVEAMKKQLADAEAAATEMKKKDEADATAFMNRHKDLPPLKNKAVADHLRVTFLNNRAIAEDIVKGWKAEDDDGMTEAERARAQKKPLHNREVTVRPPVERDEETTLHNRAMAYRDKNKVTYEQAREACRASQDA